MKRKPTASTIETPNSSMIVVINYSFSILSVETPIDLLKPPYMDARIIGELWMEAEPEAIALTHGNDALVSIR